MVNLHETKILGRMVLVNGPLGGGDALRGNIATGAPEVHTPPDNRAAKTWADYEFWIYCGQSNEVGLDNTADTEPFGIDAPDLRVMELSHIHALPVTPDTFNAARPGSVHVMRAAALDFRGATRLGPAQSFGKQRVKRHPGIKRIVILCVSVGGSGFDVGNASIEWNPGDTLYSTTITKAQGFLKANPQYTFAGMVSGLGASEVPSRTEANIVADYTAFANGMRSAIPGGNAACVLIPEIPIRPADTSGATQAATRRSRSAHLTLARDLPRCALVETSDLDTPAGDPFHFKDDNIRELGRRAAIVSDDVLDLRASGGQHAYRVQYDAGAGTIIDKLSGAEVLRLPLIEDDTTRGKVLRINRLGVDTDLTINPSAYTVSFWCKRMVGAGAVSPQDFNDFFIGGKVGAQAVGFLIARNTMGHNEPSTANPVDLGLRTPTAVLSVDTWFHVAVTFAEGTFTGYVNASATTPLAGGNGGGTYPAIDGPRAIQIGAHGALGDGSTTGSGVPDMRFDDIRILPYAMTAAEVTALYNATNIT